MAIRNSIRHIQRAAAFGVCAIAFATAAQAEPFTTCPSKAFLFQGDPTTVYGVNLATGTYAVLQANTGITGTINAVGFNDTDRYIYGFARDQKAVVRVDQDFKATYLNVTGLPNGANFFVGDTFENTYYLYRKGLGFYAIDLAPLATDAQATLQATTITTNASVNLTDFAFHPLTNQLYGVDNGTGILYEFDRTTGAARAIGDTGVTGTFGAAYFDVEGFLYLSRNQDGYVYRIDLGSVAIAELAGPTAELFAFGPSSSQNDGARCANAPIIDEDEPATIDFGDAPASYGTLIQDNGARHSLDGETYLGISAPSGKYNGPDNSSFEDADDNGVGFITPLQTGLDAVIQIIASKAGYVNAWVDWNQDGEFTDASESLLDDYLLKAGANNLIVRIPEDAAAGATWARFRFSSQQGLLPAGGATDGEVEDYAISVAEVALDYSHYPSASGWTTLAYEDNWPETADYDMNDVVMALRYSEVVNRDTGNIERIDIRGRLLALGGSYHSGFAIRIPGVPATAIDNARLQLRINDIAQPAPLEAGREEAIFIVHEDLQKAVQSNCSYFRTQTGCDQSITFSFDLSIPFDKAFSASNLPAAPYDPFIFGSPHYYHGDAFSEAPGRSLEIHLPDQAPTEAFNESFLGLAQDTSVAEAGRYYRTANNLPWAMEVASDWRWPLERVDLLKAYPNFADFVLSNGASNNDWFTPANRQTDKTF